MKSWYRNAVIYELDVETFADFDGDGIGDFRGLCDRIDYLSSLGIDCIWILPFYDSPNRDNGYDIGDYYEVDCRLGHLGNFAEFLEMAENQGLRVIVDLVVNHTSIDHPWFQAARQDPDSRYHRFYIWSKEKPEEHDQKIIFGGQQTSNWAFDKKANAYYYHTFYEHQADLDFTNPDVRDEIKRIMRFWLRLGVQGFRLDALSHMMREKGDRSFDVDDRWDLIRELRAFAEEQRPDAVLLAEVDEEPEKLARFVEHDRLHLVLNFYLCNYLFLALARGEAGPIIEALKALPKEGQGHWANFLRNHDELDLERLTDEERQEVFEAFAPEESMQIFGRGVRRRIAPMLGGDQRRLELAYSLLFTLPGTPVIRYGQEIGMGEDLTLKGRDAVRTVMQWSGERSAGFSTAAPEDLVRPVVTQGPFGHENCNVTDQRRDPDSMLAFFGRLISLRKECREFGEGRCEVVEVDDPRVLVVRCSQSSGVSLAIHNLSGEAVEVNLDLREDQRRSLMLVFGSHDAPGARGEGNLAAKEQQITLEPYGYRWYRQRRFGQLPHDEDDAGRR